MNERQQAAQQARALAQRNSTAVLSTLSKKLGGMPFGSVSPVMLTDEGHIVFYVSDIAQHARNLSQDNRLSVTLYDSTDKGDQNTQGRLTLSGHAQVIDNNDLAERYYQRFPSAEGYKKAHDFKFWQLNVEHIRFIGGFGEIFWLEPNEWLVSAPEWDHKAALGMITHMNEDHADACALILQQQLNQHAHEKDRAFEAGSVTMRSVYPDGFHLSYDERSFFIPFEAIATNGQQVRQQLVKMTHQARAA